ncbi:MAG: hypothetical protein ACT6Q7_14065 [Blastomonas fulva]|uniref:hypothetical protein n=1 Tax=Blastomonas fulva TaxID=1550728 RepID=UPI0040339F12
MPRITELCNHLADRFRFEESKVQGYARILREAGLLTTGARGVNAPDATPLDAARLLIAMMLRAKKDDAAEAVKLFGSFTGKAMSPGDLPRGTEPLVSARCEDALAKIITAYGQADVDRASSRNFTFSIVRDLAFASIEVETWPADDDTREYPDEYEFRFFHPEFANRPPEQGPSEELLSAWKHYRSGFHEVPTLFCNDLQEIGLLIAGRRE